jgi:predicted  nucleic acid-binding Zn-ribbon protein
MNTSPFQEFISLIAFDQSMHALREQIRILMHAIDELHGKRVQARELMEIMEHRVRDMKKQVDGLELELTTLDTREKELRVKLDAVHYKEYSSLKAEVEQVQQQQLRLESKVEAAWGELDTTQKEAARVATEQQAQLDELQTHIAQKMAEKETAEQQLRELEHERPAYEQRVPEQWLEKYALMRERVPDPVVSVDNGSCGSCFYKVSEQDTLALKRHALVQCKGCFRLLYIAA